MDASPNPVAWYDAHAAAQVAAYEAADPMRLHGWFAGLLPPAPALVLVLVLVLDVGAASGRDAA